jgi:hypothetical protein
VGSCFCDHKTLRVSKREQQQQQQHTGVQRHTEKMCRAITGNTWTTKGNTTNDQMATKFMSLAGNTWASNHFSNDTALRANGSVTGAVPSPELLREVREQTASKKTRKGIVCACGEQEWLDMRKEQFILFRFWDRRCCTTTCAT